ncbi:hypothetical protein ACLOJK_013291 [Asimina triloba]
MKLSEMGKSDLARHRNQISEMSSSKMKLSGTRKSNLARQRSQIWHAETISFFRQIASTSFDPASTNFYLECRLAVVDQQNPTWTSEREEGDPTSTSDWEEGDDTEGAALQNFIPGEAEKLDLACGDDELLPANNFDRISNVDQLPSTNRIQRQPVRGRKGIRHRPAIGRITEGAALQNFIVRCLLAIERWRVVPRNPTSRAFSRRFVSVATQCFDMGVGAWTYIVLSSGCAERKLVDLR